MPALRIGRLFVRPGRLLRRALGFAFLTWIAYGSGLALAVWRAAAADAAYSASGPRGNSAPTALRAPIVLDWLVPKSYLPHAFRRYPNWVYEEPGSYVPTLLVVFAAVLAGAVLGVLASTRVPVAIACPHLRASPLPSLRKGSGDRTAWRAMLLRPRVRVWVWMAWACVGGLSAALLGDAWAIMVGHHQQEAAWARGAPGSAVYIEQVLGSLGLMDAIYLIAWATLAPILVAVLAARRCFMQRERRLGARCLACGYPAQRAARCTECGAVAGVQSRTRRWWLPLAMTVWLGLSILAFIIAPYATL